MADFTTGINPVEGNMRPAQPVQDNSVAAGINAFGNLFVTAGTGIAKAVIAGDKAKIKAQQDDVISTHTTGILNLANAVEQGTISAPAARMRARAMLAQAVSNNPAMAGKLETITSSLLSSSGLGKAVIEGTEQDQMEAKLEASAAQQGFVTSDMTPEQRKLGVAAWQTLQRSQEAIAQAQAELTYKRGQLGYETDKVQYQGARQSLATGALTQQSARLGLAEAVAKKQATDAIINGAKAYTFKFDNAMSDILKRAEANGKSPEAVQAAVSEVDMQLATIQATVSQAGAGASSDLINSMIAPMKARAEATKNYLLGKSTALAYQQDLANEQARDALNFLHGADPETRRILTVSKLVPGISSSLGQAADAVMIKSLGINGGDPKETPNPVNPVVGKDSQSYQSTKGYFDSINTAVSKDNSGTLPADAKQELANNINNIMRGVLINGEQAKTPSDFNGVVTFLARPDVNTWAVKNKGMINSESASGANKVLMQQYTLTVEPLVKKEFIDAGLPNGKLDLPASPVQMGMGLGVNIGLEPAGPRLKAVFSGGGVVFMPVDPKDTNATSKAKELNKNVSPVVNNLVRATATMEGTDNFRKVYQNEFAPWFDSSPELPPIPIGETTNPKQ